jgi:hypothetical protein
MAVGRNCEGSTRNLIAQGDREYDADLPEPGTLPALSFRPRYLGSAHVAAPGWRPGRRESVLRFRIGWREAEVLFKQA